MADNQNANAGFEPVGEEKEKQENKGGNNFWKIVAAVGTVAGAGLGIYAGYKAGTRNKVAAMLYTHKEGIKKGIGFGVHEHSNIPEQDKQAYCDRNGLNREGCKEFEKFAREDMQLAQALKKVQQEG